MLQILLTTAFSIYLIVYGFIALFKKEWIWKLRNLSSAMESKDKLKNQTGTEDGPRKVNYLAVLSLILGIISLLMNIGMMIAMSRAVEL